MKFSFLLVKLKVYGEGLGGNYLQGIKVFHEALKILVITFYGWEDHSW